MTAPEPSAFTAWVERETGIRGARIGQPIVGGNSNVTMRVESDSGPLVLRHPPNATVSDKAAAGIEREFRALRALHGHAPVAEPVAWCSDPTVLGCPFSLTRFVDGIAITEELPTAYELNCVDVDALGIMMVTALAQVHSVDPAGLMGEVFGKPDGFIARQIDRWTAVRAADQVRELPLLAELSTWLGTNSPPPLRPSIIHCDFHLDNCLADRERPEIRAIIDWEMATLGDPRIDLGLCLFFWAREPEQQLGFRFIQAISNGPGTISRTALADIWSAKAGLAADDLTYFMVFSAWRLAAIVEGAYVLYRRGRVASEYARHLEHDVPALLEEAAAMIDRAA